VVFAKKCTLRARKVQKQFPHRDVGIDCCRPGTHIIKLRLRAVNRNLEGRPPCPSRNWDATERVPPSELFRLFQEFDNAFEQTSRATTVETAMIETQRNLRFRYRKEFLFCFIPAWNFFANAETEQDRLIG
jgi:hypothetical protein